MRSLVSGEVLIVCSDSSLFGGLGSLFVLLVDVVLDGRLIVHSRKGSSICACMYGEASKGEVLLSFSVLLSKVVYLSESISFTLLACPVLTSITLPFVCTAPLLQSTRLLLVFCPYFVHARPF